VLALLPPRLFDRGVDAALARLADPLERPAIVDEIETAIPTWPTWKHGWWTDKFLSFTSRFGGFRREENLRFIGRSMDEIADELGKDPYEALFDLLVDEDGGLFMTGGSFDAPFGDDVVAAQLADTQCCVMTDIVGADFDHGNPVARGAFPKVLGQMARDRGVISQQEAVRRMTSLPAQEMQLQDRGVLRPGAFADVTIFDAERIANRASFAEPDAEPVGIEHVRVNGIAVYDGRDYRPDALAGHVLRRR